MSCDALRTVACMSLVVNSSSTSGNCSLYGKLIRKGCNGKYFRSWDKSRCLECDRWDCHKGNETKKINGFKRNGERGNSGMGVLAKSGISHRKKFGSLWKFNEFFSFFMPLMISFIFLKKYSF